jgi:hypothetical protein
MICPQICRKCGFLHEISEQKYDKNGNITVFPSVVCLNEGISDIVVRFFGEEPPEWCPYVTEHAIALGDQNTEGKFWGPKT